MPGINKIEIFKPGTHTPMGGAPIEFTEQDLLAAVAAYDPAVCEAPLVVGHPKENLPAYGWVKSLSFADGLVLAQPDQVDPAFADLVNAGRYKKISAAFYAPNSIGNPKPGSYYLRHVGFLGAVPPSVKGLRSPTFADDDEGVLEFADWGHRNSASLFRRLRDWIIGDYGLEKADAILPDYEINALHEEAMRTIDPAPISSYSEPDTINTPRTETQPMVKTPEQIAAEAELQRRTDALAAQEAAFAERSNTARRAEIASFAESLVQEGRLLPKDQAGVVAFMAALPADGVVEFGEGDGKQSVPNEKWLRSFMSGLPKQVEFAEVGKGDGSEHVDNADAKSIADRAVEFQESERSAGREISVSAAVQHVTKGAGK